jgi:THAP4-like, heme-binding beta-barrel domain
MELSADLPPALVPLAWLVGTWAGAGVGGYPTVEEFRFGQEAVFSHDQRPFLSYRSRTWLLDEDGNPGRPLGTETGFWRPQPEGALEVALSHPTGYSELWIGTVDGPRIELRTDVVVRTATAKEYSAGHRLYGLVEGDLAWAFDMAAVGHPIQPHVSARLKRSG